MKSSTKGRRSISMSGWRRRRTLVVSLDEVAGVFGINACIVLTYSLT
jgi:hypothetical protein